MTQVAYYALHYGKEYLAWSIRSIQDAVDEIFIFYTPTPSYGHSAGIPCPDSREELVEQAYRFAAKPVHWIEGHWATEWQHRDFALHYIGSRLGLAQVLVVDADEVWAEGAAKRALYHVTDRNCAYAWMSYDFRNFWRSFDWMVHDRFAPIRIVDTRHHESTREALPEQFSVLHFGYAQREELMRYKWTCHGHQDELRAGWIDRFVNWQPEDTDLHPVVNNLWAAATLTPESVRAEISTVLSDHPYFGVPVIR
jgi:hypothetical protein